MEQQESNNKRQRIDDTHFTNPNSLPCDLLDFDYDFSINPNSNLITNDNIPDNLFMFVTDETMIPKENNFPLADISLPSTTEWVEPPNSTVFTIHVGGRPFKLSWESLKSDGPDNFFIEYFKKSKKGQRVMYIDKDPDLFELIAKHLRGYYVQPVDDIQNRSLLFDANYYGLSRLIQFLQEFLYVNVGGRVFRLPWSLFQKDGKHNFFTGPLMHSLLLPPLEDRTAPPVYIDRDPDIFEDIVNHLRGYTIHIRDEMHRKNLQRDAQYYVFRQLSDKLLTAQQTVAGFGQNTKSEVLLLLQDIRVANLASPPEKPDYTIDNVQTEEDWRMTQVQYKRQNTTVLHALLTQVSDICLQIHQSKATDKIRLTFEMNADDMKKMQLVAQTLKATEGVRRELYLDPDCATTIDDQQVRSIPDCIQHDIIETNWEICTDCSDECQISRLVLQRAICSVHFIDHKITLCALRLEAISSRFRLNLKRQFLSG